MVKGFIIVSTLPRHLRRHASCDTLLNEDPKLATIWQQKDCVRAASRIISQGGDLVA